MTTSESAFINEIKEIVDHEASPDGRRKAAEACFRRLERSLEHKFEGQPNADLHIMRELADFRRAMLIELEKDPPVTLGTVLDSLVALSHKRRS